MILGLGFDMVEISRMDPWTENIELPRRYFHQQELDDMAAQNKLSSQSLAARFAAKEAFGKALGLGIRGFALTDVRILSNDLGKPVLECHGKAAEIFDAAGGRKIFLSLSHEKTYAGAVVVIEGNDV